MRSSTTARSFAFARVGTLRAMACLSLALRRSSGLTSGLQLGRKNRPDLLILYSERLAEPGMAVPQRA